MTGGPQPAPANGGLAPGVPGSGGQNSRFCSTGNLTAEQGLDDGDKGFRRSRGGGSRWCSAATNGGDRRAVLR